MNFCFCLVFGNFPRFFIMAMQPPQGLDYLDPGSEVRITTVLNQDFVGEVVACDGNSRMLLLKSHRPDQPADVDDLHMINMDHVRNVEILKNGPENQSGAGDMPEPSHVDMSEVQNRLTQKLSLRSKDRPSGSSVNSESSLPSNTRPG